MTQKQLYTAKEVSELLAEAVSEDWLLRRARTAQIPHRKLGRSIRWSDGDVAKLLASAAVEPKAGAANALGQTPRSQAAARRSRGKTRGRAA